MEYLPSQIISTTAVVLRVHILSWPNADIRRPVDTTCAWRLGVSLFSFKTSSCGSQEASKAAAAARAAQRREVGDETARPRDRGRGATECMAVMGADDHMIWRHVSMVFRLSRRTGAISKDIPMEDTLILEKADPQFHRSPSTLGACHVSRFRPQTHGSCHLWACCAPFHRAARFMPTLSMLSS